MKQLVSDLGKINQKLTCHIEKEKNYRVNVLTRVCSVVKSLTSHGLPLRGDVEKFGLPTANCGNFIMAMELIA